MDLIFCGFSLIILLLLIFSDKSEYSTIIFIGLLLRLAILIVDLTHLFPVLHSGADTEMFHGVAMANQYRETEIVRTNYTVFLTNIYAFFRESNPRMVAQFVNVIFGVGVILIVRSCLDMLDVNNKQKKQIMQFVSFMPNFAIFSAILLREAWIEFFCALSLLFFLRWFLSRGQALPNILLSISSVFAASYMHAGVIGLALGYMIAFTMYKTKTKTIKVSISTLFSIALVIVVVMFYLANINILGGKFTKVELSDEYIDEELTSAGSSGGSNYMSWLNTSSPVVGFVTLPIRMILFLFSPLPIHWRGLNDFFAFAFDGFIYLIMMWRIVRTKMASAGGRYLKGFLLTAILTTTMIFGLGTSTSGTALRHRSKYLSVILVTYGLVWGEKRVKDAKIKTI